MVMTLHELDANNDAIRMPLKQLNKRIRSDWNAKQDLPLHEEASFVIAKKIKQIDKRNVTFFQINH